MALSEREQRLLRELEEQLQSEDPSFASSLQEASVGKLNVRNLVLGLLIAVAGIGVLLLSIYNQWIPVGVLGFLIMGGGVYLATTGGSGGGHRNDGGNDDGNGNGGGPGGSGPRTSAPSPSGSFMSNLEEKWEQRRQQG
ncbi:DUF3040 domain-containing protein [Nesterenkonia flava]|uniref:DUF3040 domain-containing protein n=1 Tax=Nesterenkonia flava TaxID=469799 RepID=A0ABU1FWE8_9MICC|nr:DUF3040 domain-containing protein [Nesterenkonia flava]MDR5713008.1 DUF3040 domain-containing protein [Nesterenkonia flava]